ncbi:hypothetical protein [Streptomyces sp. I05A-00742]|uniref:hypothetical protein n=1 Tax=Streptomyces sp. I05A-00742 TaxID=2732853 RepID=UPI001488BBE2|nr:hypothetical protein [Streptomyces sp. I05A-00742]
MNGPGLGPPQPHRPGRAMAVTIRVVIVAITVCTAFLVSWVPMLRVAIVRRRAADWVRFWVVLVASVAWLFMMAERLSRTVWPTVGMISAICTGLSAIGYYLWTDIRHYRAMAPPRPGGYPAGAVPAGYPPVAAGPGGYPPAVAGHQPGPGSFPPPQHVGQQPHPGQLPPPYYDPAAFAAQQTAYAHPPVAGPPVGHPGVPAAPADPAPERPYRPRHARPAPDQDRDPYMTPTQGQAPVPAPPPGHGYPPAAATPQPQAAGQGYGYPPPHPGGQDPGHQQPRPPAHQDRARPPQRIDQVRAELDELSDLLRKEPRNHRGQEQ